MWKDTATSITQICKELGVPVAPEKVKGPLLVLEFLGIILDSDKMQLQLPVEKLYRLKCMVSQWSHRKSCTKTELLSLIGHLSNACKVIKRGRLIELSTIAKELHHHLRFNLATYTQSGGNSFYRTGMGWG